MSKQLSMLIEVIELFTKKQGLTKEESFQSLLELIAYRTSFEVPVSSPWIKKEIYDEVHQTLDLDLLREDPWDWIGELHDHLNIDAIKLKGSLLSREECKRLLHDMSIQTYPYASIVDSNCGTGRMIIVAHNQLKNDVIYFGAELDTVAYRIALLNMKIYDIPARIINCNSAEHDIRAGSPNWLYVNEWFPFTHSRLLREQDTDEHEAQRYGR